MEEVVMGLCNERGTRGLLPFLGDALRAMDLTMAEQQNRLDETRNLGGALDVGQIRLFRAMELEMARWKWLKQSYLGARVEKIQHVVLNRCRPRAERLGDGEIAYADALQELVKQAIGSYQGGEADYTFEDDFDDDGEFVFFKALQPITDWAASGSATGEAVSLASGCAAFAKMHATRDLLENGEVCLT